MAGDWRGSDDLRLERQACVVAALKNRFYVLGGQNENVGAGLGMPSVEVFDADGHSLPSTVPPMLFGRFTPALAIDRRRNRIIVVGGSNSSTLLAWKNASPPASPDTKAANYPLDTVEAIDLSLPHPQWVELPRLPQTVCGAAAAIIGDVLYVVGGAIFYTGDTYEPSTHYYALELTASSATWARHPLPPQFRRRQPGYVADDRSLYIFGGEHENSPNGELVVFTPGAGEPLSIVRREGGRPALDHARWGCCAVITRSVVGVLGGHPVDSPVEWFTLNPLTKLTPDDPRMPFGRLDYHRYRFGAATIGDRIFLAGGDMRFHPGLLNQNGQNIYSRLKSTSLFF